MPGPSTFVLFRMNKPNSLKYAQPLPSKLLHVLSQWPAYIWLLERIVSVHESMYICMCVSDPRLYSHTYNNYNKFENANIISTQLCTNLGVLLASEMIEGSSTSSFSSNHTGYYPYEVILSQDQLLRVKGSLRG